MDWSAAFRQLTPALPWLVGMFLGLIIGLVISAWRYRGHSPRQCDLRAAELSGQVDSLERHTQDLKLSLALAEQRGERIPELEAELRGRETRLQDLSSRHAALAARSDEERRGMEEKLALLRGAEQQLLTQFENLANKILEEKSQTFSERNRLQLDGLLTPFRQQLGEFGKKVDDMHVDEVKDRASLRQEIQGLRQQSQEINREAVNLTRALKGDKKVQGTWGEMILERVLELSGLRKGIEYETQGGYRDDELRLFKPDVIVRLPESKDIVIDSKVSLVAYERYASLDEGPEREAALREHLAAVRNHVKTLGQKDYAALKGLRSLDFILLFMPIEAAFTLAFQHDDRLFEEAFSNRIVMVTPTTLLATLRTVENIWRYERQNENAKLIADKAGSIYDKLRGFLEDLEKLGNQIGALHRTYDDAMNKLSRGRGNLVRQAESFVDLGVKVGKPLPRAFLDQAGLEDSPDDPV
jgi:DNA recombination protein RmuC